MEPTSGYSQVRGSGSYTTRTSWRVLVIVLLLTLLGFSLALVLSRPATPVSALTTVPTKMNFQGRLTDSAGNIKPNGTYNMRLKLYTVASAGSPVWSEDRLVSAAQGVPVTNGLFSIQLGTYTSLPASLFASGPLYLEVELASPATATSASPTWSEGPMSPRNQLATSAYAYNAETLDGLDSTAFAAASGSGSYIQNTTSPQTADFNVTGSGTATSFKAALFDTATATTLNIGMNNATGISLTKDTTVAAGKTITLIGGITSLRPVSPAEGMIYFDTTAKQLLTYSNGKWQGDRTDAILVAASNSSQADKDAADYVADGDNVAGAGTIDGDQVQINQALTGASGKKVVLLAGTYVADATILIPNNTTLSGVGQGTVIELADIDATDNLIENADQTTGTGITIQDMKLDGRKDLNTIGTQYGIHTDNMGSGGGTSGREGARMKGLTITRFKGDAFTLYNTYNSSLSGNIVRGNNGSGLFIFTSSHNTITDNLFQGNNNGLFMQTGTYNTITTNNSQGNTGSGFRLFLSNNNTFSSNTTQGNNNAGFYIDSSSSYNGITSNTVTGNASYGIYSYLAHKNTISNNTLSDNGGPTANNAIYLNFVDSDMISGNSINDTSATISNDAILIIGSGSDAVANYLSNNNLGGGIINDLGTGTVYANQDTGSGNMVSRAAGAYEIQGSAPVTVYSEGLNSGTIPTGWTTSGDAVWAHDSSVKSEGSGSFKSGVLGNNQNSYLEYTYNATDYETLAFDWKVSSEYGWDFLYFCLDTTDCQKISGEQGWASVELLLSPGLHNFKWYYKKDGATAGGVDAGWIDNIRISGLQINLQSSDGSTLLAATSSNGLFTDSKLTIKAVSDARALEPSELIGNSYSFGASAGWTGISGSGQTATATHDGTIGDTTYLTFTPTFTVTPGYYRLSYDLSGATTGSLTAYVAGSFGAMSFASNRNHTTTVGVTSSGVIEFRPSSTYNGTVANVSLKKYADAAYESAFVVKDTSNTSILEVRGRGDSLYLGNDSGKNAITSSGNTSLGFGTLANAKTGGLQTAVGSYALQNSDAYWNTAFGANSMQYTTTGDANTAVGADTLTENINGFENVALGYYALHENISGDYNVSLGTYSLSGNTTGDSNIAIGSYTLDASDTGSDNVAIGGSAMHGNSSGSGNVALGVQALGTNDTGSYNMALGYAADVSSGALQNATAIGFNSAVNCSNCMALGSTGVNAVNVGIGTTSPTAQLEVASTKNPLSDLGVSSNYTQIVRNINSSTGLSSGIGFAVTNTSNNIGASIVFERTNTNSVGDLGFYTKRSTTGGADPIKAMSIQSTGNISMFDSANSDIGSWQADSSLPNPRSFLTTVTLGGYAYAIGGNQGTGVGLSSVYYSKLNADGSISSWQTSANPLPAGRESASAVTNNGYVYVLGGSDGSTTQSTVYSAKQNSDGTLSAWKTLPNALPSPRKDAVSVVSNGYLYVIGGSNGTASQATVYSAKLNSDGTVGAWTTASNSLPFAIQGAGGAAGNGYVYVIGGFNGSTEQSSVYYAKLMSDGSVGTWTTSGSTLPSARVDGSVVLSNGYVYYLGGRNSGIYYSGISYAKLNSDGSVGTWQASSTSLSTTLNHAGSIVVNGYIYVIGGSNTSWYSAVYHARIGNTLRIGGNLDLVGLQGGSISEATGDGSTGVMGGSIVAGNITGVGALTIQGSSVFNSSVAVNSTLSVSSDNATGYVQTIRNTSSTNTADGLLVDLGVANASRTTGNQFISFAGNGTVAGKIWGGASAVAYVTTGADYAEYFRADPDDLPKSGELVGLDAAKANGVTRTTSGDMIAGVVSTTPGFVGNGPLCRVGDEDCDANYEKYNVLVSLVGQVPLKVTGSVRIGDALGASDIPGVASTVSSGSIVGYALTTPKDGMVQVLIRPAILNPASGTGIQGGDGIFSSVVINGLAAVGSLVVTGDATVRGELYVEGHVIAKGAKPTITSGPAVGGSNSSAAVDGVDGAGTVTLVAATQQNTTGVLAHIRFAKPFTDTYKITLSPTNDNATDLRVYILKTSDGFDIVTKDAPQSGQTYEFDYIVMGAKN